MSDMKTAIKVFGMLPADMVKGCTITPYNNGREVGFHLACPKGSVSFSENRNSDEVVVYAGNESCFDAQGVPKTDEFYEKSRRYFTSELGASNYIKDYLSM